MGPNGAHGRMGPKWGPWSHGAPYAGSKFPDAYAGSRFPDAHAASKLLDAYAGGARTEVPHAASKFPFGGGALGRPKAYMKEAEGRLNGGLGVEP